ncbi:MAG: SpoIIE family protein phosphatase [Streptosporangiaceae bacterium]
MASEGPAHDDAAGYAALTRLVGDAGVVRDAFEQMPVVMTALDGPDHRVAAINAAYRAFTGRDDVIGMAYREVFPEIEGQQLHELLDRVYRTGDPETGREWRAQFDGPGGRQEVYADFTAVPRRAADGTVNGLLVICTDVTERVTERQMAREQATEAERRYTTARTIATELQEALLPTALPVLPRARIAARYLVAGQEQAAGGDWFDAIPLPGGTVALIVGDVVGRGVTASSAMGQLRAVLAELLEAESDLERVLERIDVFAARNPTLRAATLALAVLDPADGSLRYTTCGHPPPLIVGTDGSTRFLPGTGTGPLGTGPLGTGALGTGAPAVLGSAELGSGELVLLYSDGLIERPHRTIPEGMAELAAVAGDAVAGRTLPLNAPRAATERVCELTVELLTRTGYADDVTALATQRLAEPVPALHLEVPGIRPSLTRAREAFGGWLERLDATAEDREALHLAMVEVFTNAVEHAYAGDAEPGSIELTAVLGDDGYVECRITDHGTWQPPDTSEADRGHGLMVAGHMVDAMHVSHSDGTTVLLRHRLRRPAIFSSGHSPGHNSSQPAAYPAEPPFTVHTSAGSGGTARAQVCGPVDITSADVLTRRLLAVSRGGTVPLTADLTGVTQLASAGVSALYLVREQLAAHEQDLTLVTAPGSAAAVVLDLVRLPHRPATRAG